LSKPLLPVLLHTGRVQQLIRVHVQARDSSRSRDHSLVELDKEHDISVVESLSPTGEHEASAGQNCSPIIYQYESAADARKSLDVTSPCSGVLMVKLREHLHALCQKVQCDLEDIRENQDDPGRVDVSWHLIGGALATLQFSRARSGGLAPTSLTLWVRPAPDAGTPD
jgi:hypothetical protein